MCEFLKGPNHKDVIKIAELTEYASIERHAVDAIFSAMSDQKDPDISSQEKEMSYRLARELYSRLIKARSDKDFSGIVDLAHNIMGED